MIIMSRIRMSRVLGIFVVGLTCSVVTMAQEAPRPSQAPTSSSTAPSTTIGAPNGIPVKIDWLLTRWQGDKKTASEPYTMLAITGGGNASVRLGVQVPVAQQAFATPPDEGPRVSSTGPMPVSVSYQSVGTNIIVSRLATLDGGRYWLNLMFEESFVYGLPASSQPILKTGTPAIGTYRVAQDVIVADGRPTLVNTAVDRVSGETTKLEVTVTALK
jgi:hypothetical protein